MPVVTRSRPTTTPATIYSAPLALSHVFSLANATDPKQPNTEADTADQSNDLDTSSQPQPASPNFTNMAPRMSVPSVFDLLMAYWNRAILSIFKNLKLPSSRCMCNKALDPKFRKAPLLEPICLTCLNARVRVVLRIKKHIEGSLKKMVKVMTTTLDEYEWLKTIFGKAWLFQDTLAIRTFVRFNNSPQIIVDEHNTWVSYMSHMYRTKLTEVIAEMYNMPKESIRGTFT